MERTPAGNENLSGGGESRMRAESNPPEKVADREAMPKDN